jgi:DNA repair protein RadA/Sms
MAKLTTVYICQTCHYQCAKWLGKCPECHNWNTLIEDVVSNEKVSEKSNARSINFKEERPRKINEVEFENKRRIPTQIKEFDRVVGGGLVIGSLILVGGEPGIGKSTLLTSVLSKLSKENYSVLYVSGEESAAQVASRAKRLGVKEDKFLIYHEITWEKIEEHLKIIKPDFLVIDSIQTTLTNKLDSTPGTSTQIREVTFNIMNFCKTHNITCLIIGHITKEGTIAGPKMLEHMVDAVIYFEGDHTGNYRVLRSMKNRFGNTNEVGIFEMTENGLNEVVNPSQFFIEDHLPGAYGRSLSCLYEGSRGIFIELQALVIENKFGNGRRNTQGLDQGRLSMLVAVVEKYFSIPLSFSDIYVNIIGGIKLNNRDTDLAIISALLSSFMNKPIGDSIVFIGEVGLTGEVRSVQNAEERYKEIDQMNYKVLVTSEKTAARLKEQYPKSKVNIVGIKQAIELKKMFFNSKDA